MSSEIDELVNKLMSRFKQSIPEQPKIDQVGLIKAVTDAVKEIPITVVHHSPKDALNCPQCKPELDEIIGKAKDEGAELALQLNKRIEELAKLRRSV